jgi:hypothetical protein
MPKALQFLLMFDLVFVSACAQAGLPPAPNGQHMPLATRSEASRMAKCIVVATPVKQARASTWTFDVRRWVRGSGPDSIDVWGFYTNKFPATSAHARATAGEPMFVLLRECSSGNYELLRGVVTPSKTWIPPSAYRLDSISEEDFIE